MPDLLNTITKYKPKPNRYKLRTPPQYHSQFLALHNNLVAYYRTLITDLIKAAGQGIVFPMETDLMVRYLDGYTVNYHPFFDSEGEQPKDGYFEVADLKAGVFDVYYNIYYSFKRQRATRIHETWHIFQLIDPAFRRFIDGLIEDTELPGYVIEMLLERATEKATFMYIMPEQYFKIKFQENPDLKTLSDFFQASLESVGYRLKEVGLVSPM